METTKPQNVRHDLATNIVTIINNWSEKLPWIGKASLLKKSIKIDGRTYAGRDDIQWSGGSDLHEHGWWYIVGMYSEDGAVLLARRAYKSWSMEIEWNAECEQFIRELFRVCSNLPDDYYIEPFDNAIGCLTQ